MCRLAHARQPDWLAGARAPVISSKHHIILPFRDLWRLGGLQCRCGSGEFCVHVVQHHIVLQPLRTLPEATMASTPTLRFRTAVVFPLCTIVGLGTVQNKDKLIQNEATASPQTRSNCWKPMIIHPAYLSAHKRLVLRTLPTPTPPAAIAAVIPSRSCQNIALQPIVAK